jgi:hypothetical protein
MRLTVVRFIIAIASSASSFPAFFAFLLLSIGPPAEKQFIVY